MKRFIKILGEGVLIVSMILLAIDLISGQWSAHTNYWVLGTVIYWFTVGYIYFFEENKRVWGAIFMVITGGGIVAALFAAWT